MEVLVNTGRVSQVQVIGPPLALCQVMMKCKYNGRPFQTDMLGDDQHLPGDYPGKWIPDDDNVAAADLEDVAHTVVHHLAQTDAGRTTLQEMILKQCQQVPCADAGATLSGGTGSSNDAAPRAGDRKKVMGRPAAAPSTAPPTKKSKGD